MEGISFCSNIALSPLNLKTQQKVDKHPYFTTLQLCSNFNVIEKVVLKVLQDLNQGSASPVTSGQKFPSQLLD